MSELADIIKQRIREKGRITFAEFVEMALYTPRLGYYTSGKARVGAAGDFYTSPEAHPLFAALIALQLEQMWDLLGSPSEFTVIEAGAGKGLLARDLLAYLPHLSPLFSESVSYVTRERDSIKVFKGHPVPGQEITGVYLSNELPDAFPVHRVIVRQGRLQELYVTLEGGCFADEPGELSTPELAGGLEQEGIVLPEGYVTEVNLQVDRWMAEVADNLDRGFVITIDYGYPARELYAAHRKNGALTTYYRHVAGHDPYMRIGEQDMTAHVDFTAIARAGERSGLRSEALLSQRDFLRNLGHSIFVDALAKMQMEQSQKIANRMAMLDLVREDGMGGFGVLVQSKGPQKTGPLYCLQADNELKRGLRAKGTDLFVPLLDREHTPLMQGKYPQYERDAGYPD